MICLDLETIALPDVEIEPVSAPSNYKDPIKIAEYIAKGEADQRERAALYPYSNRIVALGWCHEGEAIERVTVFQTLEQERVGLREFWEAMPWRSQVVPIVTFAGRTFDLPTLMVRSRAHRLDYPALNLDRYRSPHPDLLELLTFHGAIGTRSLKWFAKAHGLDVSDAFGGKEIAQLSEDQNWDAIAAHCASDVRLTRGLAEAIGLWKRRAS